MVDSCHTDNGVFKSQAFVDKILSNHQSIRYSGVGAKWQNGVSESAIRIVVSKACTMMIHAALQWPDVDDDTLWPLAVSHAAYLYNHTPNPESGIAPFEIFIQTKSDGQALRNAHPWGCPTYVLEPRLSSAGGKIPKWQPRSRRAQCVGVSPVHAENIGLIRNLKTGYISPQYHLVYDDDFDTVYSPADTEPPDWERLCIFQRFETVFDDGDHPVLADEWLTPEEIRLNRKNKHLHDLRQGRKLWQDLKTKESWEDFLCQAPPADLRDPPLPPREPPPPVTRELTIVPPRERLPPVPNALTREPYNGSASDSLHVSDVSASSPAPCRGAPRLARLRTDTCSTPTLI